MDVVLGAVNRHNFSICILVRIDIKVEQEQSQRGTAQNGCSNITYYLLLSDSYSAQKV
jgi:hypothetical protein